MQLSEEDVTLNRSGTLTKEQLRRMRNKGVMHLIAGLIFLFFVPMSLFGAKIQWGVLLIIVFVLVLLFAGVFFWSAWTFLSMKNEGHEILHVSGKVEKKNSGNRNVVVKIGERSFFMRKNEAQTINDGEEYTLYFLENPKLPLGWRKNEG